MDGVKSTYSTTDLRTVHYFEYADEEGNEAGAGDESTLSNGARVRPKRIVCAEPSPNIAKAVSQSLAASGDPRPNREPAPRAERWTPLPE